MRLELVDVWARGLFEGGKGWERESNTEWMVAFGKEFCGEEMVR